MRDFRRTEYCLEYGDVKKKKENLLIEIRKEHPRAEDIHTIVSKRNSKFNKSFTDIYNKKCAYCGISIDVIGIEEFEIDHFIFKNHPRFNGSKAKASHIENLVLSCSLCNGKKSDFNFLDEDANLFNPDLGEYPTLYKRDEDYKIIINEKHVENMNVLAFYNILLLGSELRRIDYLLMQLFGEIEKNKTIDPAKAEKLSLVFFKLIRYF